MIRSHSLVLICVSYDRKRHPSFSLSEVTKENPPKNHNYTIKTIQLQLSLNSFKKFANCIYSTQEKKFTCIYTYVI